MSECLSVGGVKQGNAEKTPTQKQSRPKPAICDSLQHAMTSQPADLKRDSGKMTAAFIYSVHPGGARGGGAAVNHEANNNLYLQLLK